MVRFVEDDAARPGPAAGLAPVIPLFGGADPDLAVAQRRHPAGSARRPAARGERARRAGTEPAGADTPRSGAGAADAERALLRRLAGRSLSVAEARAVLTGFELAPEETEALVTAFEARGYLDDAALAEQLVHIAVDRKGEGRRAIGATLARRGVPREIAEAALAALPDDDRDRALAFARTRARALRGLDPDVALRRLVGQLARRGYPGGVAMDAARTALAATD